MVLLAYNPSSGEVETGGVRVKGSICLHRQFEISLGYISKYKNLLCKSDVLSLIAEIKSGKTELNLKSYSLTSTCAL